MKYILEIDRDDNDTNTDNPCLWLYSTDENGEPTHGTQLAGEELAEDADITVLASFEITPDKLFEAVQTLGSLDQLMDSISST